MTQCGTMARGRRMRLTRLDECGEPVEGLRSTLVTSGFVLVTTTPNYQDPEEINQPNANGDPCITEQPNAALNWLDANIQLCNVDPDAFELITGNPIVLNDATVPEAVGFRINQALTGTANFALELWSGVTGQPCAGGTTRYGYWLYPWMLNAQIGEWSVQNAALTMQFTARTQIGSTWGVGPYDVRNDAVTPAPEPLLTPIDDEDHMHFEFTTLAPPAAACGATELAIP